MRNKDCEVEEEIKDHIADVGNMVLSFSIYYLFKGDNDIFCKISNIRLNSLKSTFTIS